MLIFWLIFQGWGGGPRSSKEDATARERPRSNPRETHERQPEARGERESPSKRKWFFPPNWFVSFSPFHIHPTSWAFDNFGTWPKAKEEVEALEKKMVQLENELSDTQTKLETATKNLEEKEKALQNVSFFHPEGVKFNPFVWFAWSMHDEPSMSKSNNLAIRILIIYKNRVHFQVTCSAWSWSRESTRPVFRRDFWRHDFEVFRHMTLSWNFALDLGSFANCPKSLWNYFNHLFSNSFEKFNCKKNYPKKIWFL